MKLYLEKGELILPSDFSFEITHKNPFFSNEGASSAPATIPPIYENLEILGHPEDTHKTTQPVKSLDGTLSAGLFFAKCKLVMDSASKKGGVSASLALKESVMYSELQDKKLPKLFAGKIEWLNTSAWNLYKGNYYDQWGTTIIENFKKVTFFPVACDLDDNGGVYVLNKPGTDAFSPGSSVTHNDVTSTPPSHYGETPFLFLWALIEEAFKLCGYTVKENIFKTDSALKSIVVLNNTCDSQVTRAGGMSMESSGIRIRYEQIVPDITVGDFINWLRDKFGAIVCAENGEVSIRLFKTVAAMQYDMDLTPYAREEVSVSIPEPKRLEIEMGSDIDSSAPAADDLETLIGKYGQYAELDNTSQMADSHGLFYILPLGKYYFKETDTSTPALIGTDAYKYTRDILDVEPESLKTDDDFVPTIYYNGRYMPYIGESVRQWMTRFGDNQEGYSQKIMICYAHFDSTNQTFSGSSYGYDGAGNAVTGYPALTPEQFLQNYWEKYQAIILNACPEISCQLDIPIEALLSLDIATPKRFRGDLVMIKELKFTIKDSGVSSCDAVLQQIASYTDAAVAPPLNMAIGQMNWKRVSTRSVYPYGDTENGITILETDGVADYTSADTPSELPTRPGIVAKKRSRWLKYKRYSTDRSFLHHGHSEWTATHKYEEYFITEYNG